MNATKVGLLALLLGFSAISVPLPAKEAKVAAADRARYQNAIAQGNYKDAYECFRGLVLDPQTTAENVGDDLKRAVQCLTELGRVNETDALIEAAVATHKDKWRLLWSAAHTYMGLPHQGYVIAGKFERGEHRGGGEVFNSADRDRIRALQLMVQAMPLAQREEQHVVSARYWRDLAQMLLNNRGHEEAWRLQELSDLAVLPDYEPGWGGWRESSHAPVDEQGHPVYYTVPKGFEAAANDGQRWRWCLEQAIELDPQQAASVRLELAGFLRAQFGVETLAQWSWFFGRDSSGTDESGVYALHTLGEDETIARLATGIKRFKLPDEFNYIRIYQQVAEGGPAAQIPGLLSKLLRESGSSIPALEARVALAEEFENRRQYPRAAEWWRKCIEISGDAEYRNRLRQIEGNWGRFEGTMTQPAGQGAAVEYRFRNGRSVQFTAQEINVQQLLEDVKQYLKSRPNELDWEKVNISDLGYRLVEGKREKYVGREVANWTLPLEPREKHFDKQVTVRTPLQKAGAYWLTARMQGGNTCHIVVWVADTVIAKKPLDGKTLYYVADAVDGRPLAKTNVEFFGYRQEHRSARIFQILTKQYAEFTDGDGQVVLGAEQQPRDYQWLITATTPEGRLAYLGFTGVWSGRWREAEYRAIKVYAVTDRPVYRPAQKVHFKFWVRRAQYDQEDTSDFANQTFPVEIHNPKGEKILEKAFSSDAYGGIEGELDLPADAMLGVYRLAIVRRGGGSFRVEEYKKPEFEVTVDAPAEPVMLGQRIEATIKAKYYFGSPVTNAKVKYKVTRTKRAERWYPLGPWDWLYGAGYWWFAADYEWYPGWRDWGCWRPLPFWMPASRQPPEVIADREAPIGPDGTVKVEIDTAPTKALYPNDDHQYTITAEVVDQSRRTIVGSGQVLVGRKPFAVTVWTGRGYYRAGDTVQVRVAARRLDGKRVQGQGKLELLAIRYQDGKPVETAVERWDLATNEEGAARMQVRAAQAGQYRLAYTLADAQGQSVTGGYVFSVMGAGSDEQFRFNALELIPDKAEYQPDEKVRLLVNAARRNGTVLLFVRPSNGVYLPPQILRLEGKSRVQEITVAKKDMPNFFVEALTIADGRVHSEVKEIIVPPEKRVLNVTVEPSQDSYRPGQDATVRLRLTDFHGQPFVGSTVVAIYDKSVEYVSGGSNVPDIKAFFWKWRRRHNPQTESSLQRGGGNIDQPDKPGMSDVGVFGHEMMAEVGAGFNGRGGGGMMMYSMEMSGARRGGAPMLAKAMAEPSAAPRDAMAMGGMADKAAAPAAEAESAPAMVEPTVRSQFADTAFWAGALTTEADGTATVALKMPENLTTWRIKVWGMGHGTKVGEGVADVVTRKDLIVRMQAPRFFVQKDEVVLSANVHNYLKSAKSVRVLLEVDGRLIAAPAEAARTVQIAAGEEARVDWRVQVLDEGETTIRMKALSDEESDAMEMKFPCYVHGMLKMEAASGTVRPSQEAGRFTFNVPQERRPAQSRLEIRWSPTLAGAMVDALPYLADYPYGCTEQTLNRFLPSVITQKILLDMGLKLEEIRDKRANLNAQELGDAQQRAGQWKRRDRNPVFDEAEVQRMVKEGVQRLNEMQLSDGGWGWFSGWGEYPSAHTTAIVVHGLQIAQANDVALVPSMLERGVAWLTRYQEKQVAELQNALVKPKKEHWKEHTDNVDALVYMVLVDAGVKSDAMRDFLYRDRTQLAVYGLGMYGLALHKQQEAEKLAMVLQNISQYVQQDDENQTAWLKLPERNYWWCWYNSEYEAQAYYLKLLSRTDPKGELASRLVKYLLNNRKHATFWNSTRDTALCVEAMADFLRASGEDKPEMTVEVWLDGQLQKAVEITAANLFQFDDRVVLEGEQVTTGQHQVELKRKGRGPLYYNGYLTTFTLEDFIRKAGLEVKVDRKYYRLKKVDAAVSAAGARGQVVQQKIEKYERLELANDAVLTSGDLVEIELEIDSKNDYEYLIFEDMKPAGFEPVDLRSGYTGNALGAYTEFRDNRVVFFVSRLARGKHSVAYRMRAEIPGRFSALPTRAWAMYAPELKGNSDEIKLGVKD